MREKPSPLPLQTLCRPRHVLACEPLHLFHWLMVHLLFYCSFSQLLQYCLAAVTTFFWSMLLALNSKWGYAFPKPKDSFILFICFCFFCFFFMISVFVFVLSSVFTFCFYFRSTPAFFLFLVRNGALSVSISWCLSLLCLSLTLKLSILIVNETKDAVCGHLFSSFLSCFLTDEWMKTVFISCFCFSCRCHLTDACLLVMWILSPVSFTNHDVIDLYLLTVFVSAVCDVAKEQPESCRVPLII